MNKTPEYTRKAIKDYDTRMKDKGMKKVCVYVPENKTEEIKKTAQELRKTT